MNQTDLPGETERLRDKEISVVKHMKGGWPDGCMCDPCVTVREAVNLDVAGAYAAAAKHPVSETSKQQTEVGTWHFLKCGCGEEFSVFYDRQLSKFKGASPLDQWADHIRALTPADAVCPPGAKEHVMRLHYLLYVNERGKHIGHCLDFDIVTSADSRDEALKRLNILVGVHMERAVAKTPAPPEFWDRFHKVRQVCIADEAAARTPDSTKEPEKS